MDEVTVRVGMYWSILPMRQAVANTPRLKLCMVDSSASMPLVGRESAWAIACL